MNSFKVLLEVFWHNSGIMNMIQQITVTLNENKDCLKPLTYIVLKENFKTHGYSNPKMKKALDRVCPDT